MKSLYFLPLLAAATPALAHPAELAHTHAADWMLPLGLALIGVAAVSASARRVRVRK